jgi:hypothetical protein
MHPIIISTNKLNKNLFLFFFDYLKEIINVHESLRIRIIKYNIIMLDVSTVIV